MMASTNIDLNLERNACVFGLGGGEHRSVTVPGTACYGLNTNGH